MLRLRHVATGIAIFAAACSESPAGESPLSNTAVVSQDLADLAADGAAEDVGMMGTMDGQTVAFPDAAALMGGGGPRVGDCTFESGSFHCARTRENGLDVERTVTFFDGNGAGQSAYDKRTTASVHVVANISGTITRGPLTATVARTHDFVVSGLLGAETTRTVNGSGTESASKSGTRRNGTTRSYAVAGTTASVAVVFPVHSEDSDPWPLSGTSTRVFTITPTEGAVTTRTVVINFDGTATPTGTVNGEPFTFDLTHRRGIRR